MNGQLNGTADKNLSGGDIPSPVVRKRSQPAAETSTLGSLVSIAARLLLWYSLITAIFRCPSSTSSLADDSPKLCKYYLPLRDRVAPHVEPHYNTYLKPYVDQARPHVNRFNEKVSTPAYTFAKQHYDVYGAPQVARIQSVTDDAWSNTLRPRLQIRSKWAKAKYAEKLSPHVNQAATAAEPYVVKLKDEVVDIYDSTIIPTYDRSLPYVQDVYSKGQHIIVDVVFPYLQAAERSASSFLSRRVWPQLVILYGENVEPQLMKISERLGRYKDAKKLQAAVTEREASSKAASLTSKATSAASSVLSASQAPSSKTESLSATHEAKEDDSREKIESDLKIWQKKFAQAADRGSEDLQDRVKEITSRQIDNQAHVVGKAFVVRLEQTASSSIDELKYKINDVVKGLPEEANEHAEAAAYEKILTEVRATGSAIKERAQSVRTWKQRYDNDTRSLVQAALQSTYNVIDNVRDLGLQEIGMRWAWMEGVTYQDWSKYHDLKSTFDEWRNGVANVALGHQGLKSAQEEGETIQDNGMDAAEKAAKELARLKEVARWKIDTRDSSDNFSAAGPARKAAQRAVSVAEAMSESIVDAPSSISEAIYGSQGTSESLASKASVNAESVVSAASTKTDIVSSAIHGTPGPASSIESKVSKVFGGAMAASIHGEPQQPILDTEFTDADDNIADRIQSMLSVAGDKASDLTSAVSDAFVKPTATQGSVDSLTSLASEQYAKALSAASSALYGTTPGVVEKLSSAVGGSSTGAVESLSSVASDKYAQAVTAASYAIYGTPAPVIQSLSSQASAQYDEAKKIAMDRYSKASIAAVGSPKPAYETAMSSIASAYSDSISAASVKLQSALGYTASVTSLWAKPTQGTFESISSAASVKLQQGLVQASAQYESAKSAVGAQPTPARQKYLVEAQKQYYQGVGLAHDRYSQFLTAASGAVYGTPTPAYQSWLSVAQAQYTAAASAASVKYNEVLGSASSVVGQTSKSPAQSVLDSASSQYNNALSAASEALLAASSSASLAVYGTPTGKIESLASVASSSVLGTETRWTEAAASQASENWEALVSGASERIYGSPTPWHESAWSQAGGYAAQATDAAAIQYSAVQALINDLVVGKEPDFTESVMGRFSSAYHTGMFDYVSSASSVASDAYASASSVVSSVFTPPATLEAILDSASEQLNAAVEAASIGIYGSQTGSIEKASSAAANAYGSAQSKVSEAVYGTQTGSIEKASSAAASAYGSAQSKVSEAIYGTQTGYAEAAQSSLADVASSAQSAISVAIYGTPTGTVEAATSGAASVYSSVTSVAADNLSAAGDAVKDSYNAASSRISEAIYGPEQGAVESATNRLAVALESARARLGSMAEGATGAAAEQIEAVRLNVEDMASSVGSMASSVTSRVKDEL